VHQSKQFQARAVELTGQNLQFAPIVINFKEGECKISANFLGNISFALPTDLYSTSMTITS
jgi:hypothetical protein